MLSKNYNFDLFFELTHFKYVFGYSAKTTYRLFVILVITQEIVSIEGILEMLGQVNGNSWK